MTTAATRGKPPRRRGEGTLHGPAAIDQSVVEHSVWDPEATHPVADDQALAAKLDPNVASCVSGLLFPRRPAAVARLVVAVVVREAIEAMSRRRARPHVSQERLERVAPAVANADAPSAVALEVWPTRIGASRSHARPRLVLRRGPVIARMPVCGPCGNQRLAPIAPAACRQSESKAHAQYKPLSPAGAATDPPPAAGLAVGARPFAQDGKPTELLTSHIVEKHGADSTAPAAVWPRVGSIISIDKADLVAMHGRAFHAALRAAR